jgi:restriction system protein
MVEIPTHVDLMLPALSAIEKLGGSATRAELRNMTLAVAAPSDDEMAVTFPEGSLRAGTSKIVHRVDWAITYLVMIGALDNPRRGFQTLTPIGRELLSSGSDIRSRIDTLIAERNATRRSALGASDTPQSDNQDSPADTDGETGHAGGSIHVGDDLWKIQLIDKLLTISPKQFEVLAARLLREEGCEDVRVSGGANDGGIDGTATLRVSLLSFPVFFQAKRYAPNRIIGPSIVRELRGSLQGRGDKGILITTSSFSTAAREEANRAGSPIDLIDGDELCDLLAKHGLGVEPRPTLVEQFFAQL